VFVVDVSNVSHHQQFVKKKVEKSLLFRFSLEFFDLVSPMVLLSIRKTTPFFIEEPLDLDKRLFTGISGIKVFTTITFIFNFHYHSEGCIISNHILVLIATRCG